MGSKLEFPAWGADGCPDGIDAGIEHADNVAGVSLLDDPSRSWAISLLGTGQADLLPPAWYTSFSRQNRPDAGAHKGDAVPVGLVHVGLDLERRRKIVDRRIDPPLARLAGQREVVIFKSLPGRGSTPKLVRLTEEHRGELAVADAVMSKSQASAVQRLHLIHQLIPARLADQLPSRPGSSARSRWPSTSWSRRWR